VDAARLICGATAKCHLTPLYEETKLEKLSVRRKNHRLTIFYKMVYGLAPPYLMNLLPDKVHQQSRHNLRNRNDFTTPITRINAHKYSFLPSTIRDWNTLDLKIKESPSINSFKTALRKHKDKPPLLYYLGARRTSAMLCRMRLGCSPLRHDLCKELKVIDSGICACGGGEETHHHFFYHCPIYAAQRVTLMEELYKIGNFNIRTILYGNPKYDHPKNKLIFDSVYKFIETTNRFN
jgi:hypothetical protein